MGIQYGWQPLKKENKMKIKYAIETLESELKSLKRQRDTFIFQESYKMRYGGEEIKELENALRILKGTK